MYAKRSRVRLAAALRFARLLVPGRIFVAGVATLAALAALASVATAGPNQGGTLVLAEATGYDRTFDQETFCPYAPETCFESVSRHDGYDIVPMVLCAAFPEGSSPRLAGLTFGVDYDDSEVFLTAWGSCGDFELPTAGFPAPGEGTAVTFDETRTDLFTPTYWFTAYNYYGNPQTFDIIPHPVQGANFGDDTVLPELDPIADLGSYGFSTDGYTPCPAAPGPGQCCFYFEDCQVLEEDECDEAGGSFTPDMDCSEPCVIFFTGGCCTRGDCFLTSREACEEDGGLYLGDGVFCDGDPCEIVPTVPTSWGAIKSRYAQQAR